MKTNTVVVVVTLVVLAAGCATAGREQPRTGEVAGWATGTTTRAVLLGAVVGGPGGAEISARMDHLAGQLSHRLGGARVARVGEGVAVSFPAADIFETGAATLTLEGRFALHQLADVLMAEPRTTALVSTHGDVAAEPGADGDLTARRSEAAVEYILTQGIAFPRLDGRGRGTAEPLDDGGSAGERQLNRRVEVAIYASNAWQEQARRARR